jgi:selenocysteine-specific elongation factor
MTSVVVGTAGHIDHGKSALVQALTGTDPDRLKEEKARGITIDLGFARQTIEGITYAFVDVPGHERFIKNMLAGVGGIDLVVLVIAADESVMPQTREHFDICRLLRVPAGLVALTKSDLVDEETLELVRLEVRELVAGSFLDGAPMVPVSSRTGIGLDLFRAALVEASRKSITRSGEAATRLPIDRVFTMKGFGTVVTGTLVSGRIDVDAELMIAPGSRRVKVRGVQVHGERRTEAVAGQRAAINLSGVEVDNVARGQSLVTVDAFEETRVVDAAVEMLPGAAPLEHGARVHVHQGTAEMLGRVGVITPNVGGSREEPVPAPGADGKSSGRPAIGPGSRGFVRLRLEASAVLTRGDRFILRSYSPLSTVGGGVVLDPRPRRGPIRSKAALERCRRLDFEPLSQPGAPGLRVPLRPGSPKLAKAAPPWVGAAEPGAPPAKNDPDEAALRAAEVMIAEAAAGAFPMSALVSRVAVAPGDAEACAETLVTSGRAVRAGDVLVAPRVFTGLGEAIVSGLTTHHREHPLSEGVPREELRERLFRRGHPAVFDRVLENLAAAGTVVARDRVALSAHRVVLSPDEERTREAIERIYRESHLTPPDASSLAALVGASEAVVDRVLMLLQRQKTLVRIADLFFHQEALGRLKADVVALKGGSESVAKVDVAGFKERFGVTRKFAIPLLEYLDRERVTRRVGDARIVL